MSGQYPTIQSMLEQRKASSTGLVKLEDSVSYEADLPAIVHAFGGPEDEAPYSDTIDVLNTLVKEYIVGMTDLAIDAAICRGSMDASCFRRLYASDARKKEHMASVLGAREEILQALRVDLGEAILFGPPPERKKPKPAVSRAAPLKKAKGN